MNTHGQLKERQLQHTWMVLLSDSNFRAKKWQNSRPVNVNLEKGYSFWVVSCRTSIVRFFPSPTCSVSWDMNLRALPPHLCSLNFILVCRNPSPHVTTNYFFFPNSLSFPDRPSLGRLHFVKGWSSSWVAFWSSGTYRLIMMRLLHISLSET